MPNSPFTPAGIEKIWQVAFDKKLTIFLIAAKLFIAMHFRCCRQCHKDPSITFSMMPEKPSCVIDTKYPVWFFHPPRGTVCGYYHDTINSLSDAKIRAAGYHSMRFYGKFRYYEDERTDDFQDSISFYFMEPDTVLAESLQVADSFFMCCTGKIYLLAEKNSAIDTTRVDASSKATDCNIQNGIHRLK